MILETKYDLNQDVYLIKQDHRKEWVPCPACGGKGHVTLLNGDRTCPECYGRAGSYINLQLEWMVGQLLTIGKVSYEVTNIKPDGIFDNVGSYKEGNNKVVIKYMAYQTGVGSGTLWPEEKLFPTREEAEQECVKRNQEKSDGNT